jgi:hypothetical protein
LRDVNEPLRRATSYLFGIPWEQEIGVWIAGLRSKHGVAAEAADLKIKVSGVEGVAQSGRGLCASLASIGKPLD